MNEEPMQRARNSTVVFVNNAADVFGSRSSVEGHPSLDWHVARMACGLQVDSRLLCFTPLEALEEEPTNKCFERTDPIVSGRGATTWTLTSGSRIKYYVYTKTKPTWKCRFTDDCGKENELLQDRNEVNETIRVNCAFCGKNNEATGYTTREKKKQRQQRQ